MAYTHLYEPKSLGRCYITGAETGKKINIFFRAGEEVNKSHTRGRIGDPYQNNKI